MTEGATQGGLPVRAEPLQRAEKISRLAVDFVGVEDGALPLEVDPRWDGGHQRFAGSEGRRGRRAAQENQGRTAADGSKPSIADMKDDEGGAANEWRRFDGVRDGAARFETGVQTGSIRQATSLPTGRYPECKVWVRFPILMVPLRRMLRLKRSISGSTTYERRRLEASGGLGMRQVTGKNGTEAEGRGLFLWDRIIGLLEQDLDWRRSRKLFVTLKGESGSCQKEIGELSASERGSLAPDLGGYVADQLIERYLAEQGRVDLFEGRHAYTKRIRDLAPTDLPALIEAERHRVKESQMEQERAEFVEVVRRDLDRLELVAGTD